MLNTTSTLREIPKGSREHVSEHVINTSAIYDDEAEILAVLPGTGWCASVNGEAVPLAAFVALDTGRMYGASIGIDGRVDLLSNDVEKHPGFAGYKQTNNDKEL